MLLFKAGCLASLQLKETLMGSWKAEINYHSLTHTHKKKKWLKKIASSCELAGSHTRCVGGKKTPICYYTLDIVLSQYQIPVLYLSAGPPNVTLNWEVLFQRNSTLPNNQR